MLTMASRRSSRTRRPALPFEPERRDPMIGIGLSGPCYCERSHAFEGPLTGHSFQ